MKLERFMVLTLDDKTEIIVLSSVVYNGDCYVFADTLTEDGEDMLGQYGAYKMDFNDKSISQVFDEELLKILSSMFEEDMKEIEVQNN